MLLRNKSIRLEVESDGLGNSFFGYRRQIQLQQEDKISGLVGTMALRFHQDSSSRDKNSRHTALKVETYPFLDEKYKPVILPS